MPAIQIVVASDGVNRDRISRAQSGRPVRPFTSGADWAKLRLQKRKRDLKRLITAFKQIVSNLTTDKLKIGGIGISRY
ncbi:MAG: hypothetical protein ACE5FH_00215 [Candidatus Zixiibacteriota bacterium]